MGPLVSGGSVPSYCMKRDFVISILYTTAINSVKHQRYHYCWYYPITTATTVTATATTTTATTIATTTIATTMASVLSLCSSTFLTTIHDFLRSFCSSSSLIFPTRSHPCRAHPSLKKRKPSCKVFISN